MALTSLNSSLLTKEALASQASPKAGNKTTLARHLVDPLLALLKSEQIQATRGEMNALLGLETRLRSLRSESFSEFLGRDLLALAQDYLYSVTFQPLALSILSALKDSSLPQAAAAASLLASFEGTAGSLGQHLTHQLRRVTQTETLIPMAAAIASGSLAGSLFRAGITGMLRGSAVARLGGGAALHTLSAAGSLAGNAAVFPIGLGAGNLLVGQASGLESLHSYNKSFLHGLTLMGTLGAAGWLGRSFRWGLHGTRFVRGVEQATRLRSLTRLTATTIPFSAEIGGLMFMNSRQESGKLGSYYFAGALGMMLECRLGGGIAHGLAPSLYRVGTLLDQQAYRWAREGLTRSWQGLRSGLGKNFLPPGSTSVHTPGLSPAAAMAAGNKDMATDIHPIALDLVIKNKDNSDRLREPTYSFATAATPKGSRPLVVTSQKGLAIAVESGSSHIRLDLRTRWESIPFSVEI